MKGDGDEGYFLEVDIRYSEKLHHDFPFLPEK